MKGVIVHTNGKLGRTIQDIDHYHRSKGWNGCGYHEVIHEDGSRHRGRADGQSGAHTEGLNDWYGICFIGDGTNPPTGTQYLALVSATVEALRRFDVRFVLGHREAGQHGGKPTAKSCPGEGFDLDRFRADVFGILERGFIKCPTCEGEGIVHP